MITRLLWNKENRRCFYDMYMSADHRRTYESQYGIEFQKAMDWMEFDGRRYRNLINDNFEFIDAKGKRKNTIDKRQKPPVIGRAIRDPVLEYNRQPQD